MKQSAMIEAEITVLNNMEWPDQLHSEYSEALDKLENLFMALLNYEDSIAGDGGRNQAQERADYLGSVV